MLPELSESQARGEVSHIYAEVRELCAVPYVSSLHRHLATRPGWLEWCWSAVRPAFVSGQAQTAAWAAAATVQVAPLPPLTRAALSLLGVDGAAEAHIRAVCESFVRVSPTNLMFVALVRAQLERSDGASSPPATAATWTPSPSLPALPAMVDMTRADAALRDTLLTLSNTVAGQPFVPGLYRMLAHWPAYLAHIATELGPYFADTHTTQACHGIAQRVDAASAGVLDALPPAPTSPPRPPASEHAEVFEVMSRYRETSPQMVLFGTLLRDALPSAGWTPARK
jgi:hypothetical protein